MIHIHRIPKEEWVQLADLAHTAIFKEGRPTTQDRIDFALLAVDLPSDILLGYVTCREISPTLLYWSYGGAFPPAALSPFAWRSYEALHAKSWQLGYKTILTLIGNANAPMLRLAAKLGYKIIGLRHVENTTLLEHQIDAPT